MPVATPHHVRNQRPMTERSLEGGGGGQEGSSHKKKKKDMSSNARNTHKHNAAQNTHTQRTFVRVWTAYTPQQCPPNIIQGGCGSQLVHLCRRTCPSCIHTKRRQPVGAPEKKKLLSKWRHFPSPSLKHDIHAKMTRPSASKNKSTYTLCPHFPRQASMYYVGFMLSGQAGRQADRRTTTIEPHSFSRGRSTTLVVSSCPSCKYREVYA